MKHVILAAAIPLALCSGVAAAGCTTTRVTAMLTTLGNQKVCGVGVGSSDRWQEEHRTPAGTANNLVEVARGSGDPIDPTRPVGKWSVDDTADTVTYTYHGGGVFVFQLFRNGAVTDPMSAGAYSFCNGAAEVATAAIVPLAAACP